MCTMCIGLYRATVFPVQTSFWSLPLDLCIFALYTHYYYYWIHIFTLNSPLRKALRIKVGYFWENVDRNDGAWESEIAQNVQNNDKLHMRCFQNKELLNITPNCSNLYFLVTSLYHLDWFDQWRLKIHVKKMVSTNWSVFYYHSYSYETTWETKFAPWLMTETVHQLQHWKKYCFVRSK